MPYRALEGDNSARRGRVTGEKRYPWQGPRSSSSSNGERTVSSRGTRALDQRLPARVGKRPPGMLCCNETKVSQGCSHVSEGGFKYEALLILSTIESVSTPLTRRTTHNGGAPAPPLFFVGVNRASLRFRASDRIASFSECAPRGLPRTSLCGDEVLEGRYVLTITYTARPVQRALLVSESRSSAGRILLATGPFHRAGKFEIRNPKFRPRSM